MSPKTAWFSLVTAAVVLLDQATKIAIVKSLAYRTDVVEVIPGFFQLVHVRNSGAAFGMLADHDHRMVVFAVFTLFAAGVIVSIFRDVPAHERFLPATLGLILGGAVGNGIDRVHKQSVTDFLRFYVDHPEVKRLLIDLVGTNQYPSFNVADVAICAGVAAFVVHYLVWYEDPEDEASERQSA